MNKEEFCSWIKEIREETISRKEMASRYPWHENTLKSYEKDRLPDVDYLYALSFVSSFPFQELLRERLVTGINELNFPGDEKEKLLEKIDSTLKIGLTKELSTELFKYSIKASGLSPLEVSEKYDVEIDGCPELIVEDDAMAPTIQKGAKCKVDLTDTNLSPGAVYGFCSSGKTGASLSALRRVQSSISGPIILVTDNPNYPPQEFTDEMSKEVKVLGRIKSVTNPL